LAREKRLPTAPAAGSIGRDPFDDLSADERDETAKAGVLPDLFRKMMAAGFSGLFTTEAAIRSALGDSVPREWVDFVAEQSERTRAEMAQRLAQEFGRVLERVDLVELAEQLLEGRTIEVKAELRLGPRREASREAGEAGSREKSPSDARGAGKSEDAPRSKTR
jgi:hypothetical protein